MNLEKLSLINFKNYAQADLEFLPGINCFTGFNGVGKTNLLDAMFYLSFCKSYFNSSDSQNIRHSNDFFVIQGEYERLGQPESIYCGFKRRQKKKFKRNGKEYQKLSEHIGLIPVVIVSPDDSVLIRGGSEERRKFIDSLISQYDKAYLQHLIGYNRVLSQRNALLKSDSPPDAQVLEALDVQLAELGEKVYTQRKLYIENMTPIFQQYYDFVSRKHETVSLQYRSQLKENRLLDLLKDVLPKDRLLQHTSVGIHRDDLVFRLGQYAIKRSGSQGQQKTYLIALKFAQFEYMARLSGQKPILLLDDIFDKLDQQRVEQIVKLVAGKALPQTGEGEKNQSFGQIFITDTHSERLLSVLESVQSQYRIFEVKNGTVVPK